MVVDLDPGEPVHRHGLYRHLTRPARRAHPRSRRPGSRALTKSSSVRASSSPCAGSIRVSPMYSGCGPTGARLLRSRSRPSTATAFIDSSSTPWSAAHSTADPARCHEPPRDLVLEQHVGVHDVAAAAHDVAGAPQRVHVAVLREPVVEAFAGQEVPHVVEGARAVPGDRDHVLHTGPPQALERAARERDVADLEHRLRAIVGQRAQAQSFARRQIDGWERCHGRNIQGSPPSDAQISCAAWHPSQRCASWSRSAAARAASPELRATSGSPTRCWCGGSRSASPGWSCTPA